MGTLTKAVGKDPLLQHQGGSLFQAFKDLLKQREALDHQILRLQGRFFKMIEQKSSVSDNSKKTYVERMHNKVILRDAIRKCMTPNKEMNMTEILSSLQKSGNYKTQSIYFYTMVNNKLNRDPLITKISRGIFVLKKKSGRSKKVS